MAITVRLPAALRIGSGDLLTIDDPIRTVAELVEVLDRRIPGFRDQLEDSVFNFAVNDEMLLHRARERALADGDVVEIIPTISGGQTAECPDPGRQTSRALPPSNHVDTHKEGSCAMVDLNFSSTAEWAVGILLIAALIVSALV